MLKWLRRAREQPLAGAPMVRRQKTYSAQSGYVYQYYYEGCRPAGRGATSGTDYVFRVSSGPRGEADHSVIVSNAALTEWQRAHGRELNGTERYAIAKMALFQAFDERPTPEAVREEVRVQAGDVESLLASLAID